MDVLSDVITVMRTGTPISAKARWYGRFGQRFASVPGAAGFRVVTEGACWLFPAAGPPVALNTGDIVFFPHGREHALADALTTPLAPPRCDSEDTTRRNAPPRAGAESISVLCGAYELDSARTHPLLASLPEVVHLSAGTGNHTEIRSAVTLLDHELEQFRPGTGAVVPALLDTLLLYIMRTWLDQTGDRDATGWAVALRDPGISAALHSIHDDPGGPWTVASLGRQAGLSRAAFSRRFRTVVGQPPLTYLTWWRMTLAARMLQESDVPNSTVARRLGYASDISFGKAFKRHHGSSPGSFRR